MNTVYHSKAAVIRHKGKRPEDFEHCIDLAAKNTHLPGRATKLLKYYAAQYNGYQTWKTSVTNHTGITQNKISYVRDQLIKRNFIEHIPYTAIVIRWDIIKSFAMLPKPLEMKGGHFYPVAMTADQRDKLTMAQLAERYHLHAVKPGSLTPDREKFINWLLSLTPQEYRIVSLAIFGQEPPAEYPIDDDDNAEEQPQELDESGKAWAAATPKNTPFDTMTVDEWERNPLPYVDTAWIDSGEITVIDILTASQRLRELQKRDGTPQEIYLSQS